MGPCIGLSLAQLDIFFSESIVGIGTPGTLNKIIRNFLFNINVQMLLTFWGRIL